MKRALHALKRAVHPLMISKSPTSSKKSPTSNEKSPIYNQTKKKSPMIHYIRGGDKTPNIRISRSISFPVRSFE